MGGSHFCRHIQGRVGIKPWHDPYHQFQTMNEMIPIKFALYGTLTPPMTACNDEQRHTQQSYSYPNDDD